MTRDISDLASMWPRTKEFGDARCYAFQCADLLELNCTTVLRARKGVPCFVAILNANDDPLALIPLCIERRHGTRLLTFVDGGLSDLNAPVIFPLSQEWDAGDIQLVWDGLRRVLRFDVAILEKMPSTVWDLPNPLCLLPTVRDFASDHIMTLSGYPEKEIGGPSICRNIKRKERKLRDLGEVVFEIAETASHYDAIVQVFARQKTRRYLETRGIDGLARPGYRAFLTSAKDMLYPSGPVCAFALRVGDVVIATVLGYVVGVRFYYLMPSFEGGDWGSYSPGHVLIKKIAEWSCANGLKQFDFGVGDEPYKLKYCDTATDLYRSEIAATMWGMGYLAVRAGWWKVRRI